MNQILFHSFNIQARSTNRAFDKFMSENGNKEIFVQFKYEVQKISDDLSDIYSSFQKSMIDVAANGNGSEEILKNIDDTVIMPVDVLFSKTKIVIDDYVKKVSAGGHDTSMLLMEPWGFVLSVKNKNRREK